MENGDCRYNNCRFSWEVRLFPAQRYIFFIGIKGGTHYEKEILGICRCGARRPLVLFCGPAFFAGIRRWRVCPSFGGGSPGRNGSGGRQSPGRHPPVTGVRAQPGRYPGGSPGQNRPLRNRRQFHHRTGHACVGLGVFLGIPSVVSARLLFPVLFLGRLVQAVVLRFLVLQFLVLRLVLARSLVLRLFLVLAQPLVLQFLALFLVWPSLVWRRLLPWLGRCASPPPLQLQLLRRTKRAPQAAGVIGFPFRHQKQRCHERRIPQRPL